MDATVGGWPTNTFLNKIKCNIVIVFANDYFKDIKEKLIGKNFKFYKTNNTVFYIIIAILLLFIFIFPFQFICAPLAPAPNPNWSLVCSF